MVKKGMVRFSITMTKEQEEWLTKCAKTMHCSKSKAIVWLISKNAINLVAKQLVSDLEIKEIIRICKTPWIDAKENEWDI